MIFSKDKIVIVDMVQGSIDRNCGGGHLPFGLCCDKGHKGTQFAYPWANHLASLQVIKKVNSETDIWMKSQAAKCLTAK